MECDSGFVAIATQAQTHASKATGAVSLLRAIEPQPSVEHGQERAMNGVARRLADTGAARRDLGFRIGMGVEAGLRELGRWWEPQREAIAAGRAVMS
ncbi:UNVERIFIED_CONTAM: hypothetical protein DES50_101259 [Williamsia faeni]